MNGIAGQEPPSEVDVAIVGAGAAGLAAGRHLRGLRPDLSLHILEAGPRCGGRALTAQAGPDRIPVDLGCGWLHGGRDNAWTVIAARTGFALDQARSSWDGAGRDLGLDPADARAADQAIGAFFARADAYETDVNDVPFSAALQPACRWNGLIGAIGTFINGVELEQASLRDYQCYDPGRGPDPRVREGYGQLVQSYGASLPISLNAAVTRIDHAGKLVVLETGRGSIRARAAILAVPTGVLEREQLRFEPGLPAKSEAAAGLPLGLANKLFLGIPTGVTLPAEHHVMGTAEDARTAGYHVRPFGRPVIECYFGGTLARDLEREGPDAQAAFAPAELARHFEPTLARRLLPLRGSAWAGTPWINGAYSYARPGAAGMRQVLAQPIDGRLFFAGEACSRHRFSTAHGAYETGVAAAEAAAAALPAGSRVRSG